MNQLAMTVMAVFGRGSILADEQWSNTDIAVIGVCIAVVAFLAACIWRAGTARKNGHLRKI